jgi:predicted nucleotidyltransferase
MDRQELIDALTATVRENEDVRAAWLGGSDATGRTDRLSDVDLLVIAVPDRVDAVVMAIEATLASLSPIAHRYRIPPPAWHGGMQTFYRLERAGPHTLLDLLVMKTDAEERFLERERHGDAVVLIDRDGMTTPPPLDRAAHDERMQKKLDDIRGRFPIFQSFVLKSIERGQPTDAMQFFRGMTLIPLVELLRIRHCPDRFDFGLRYLDRDLPAELKATIDRLSYAGDMDTLKAHHTEAVALFEKFATD